MAACGSSAALPRSELVSKANAICASAQKSAAAVPSPANLQNASGYFDKIAPITDKETSTLDGLKPDSSSSSQWNAFITAQKAANGLLRRLKAKADAKDSTAVLQSLRQVPSAGQQVQNAAAQLGATTCGR